MEILLWLQPLFIALGSLSGALLVLGVVIALASVMIEEGIESIVRTLIRLKFWVVGILAIFLVSATLGSVDTSYKNILFYRGINSKNAAEMMDSSARILKLAEKYVESKVKDGKVQED